MLPLHSHAGFRARRIHKKYGPLAQLVEQLTLNQLVVGSIPTRPTNSEMRPFSGATLALTSHLAPQHLRGKVGSFGFDFATMVQARPDPV
jgi:hypothetical protein